MQKRDKNYRRNQEATHYKKIPTISVEKLGRYVELEGKDGNKVLIPAYKLKYGFDEYSKIDFDNPEYDSSKTRSHIENQNALAAKAAPYKRWKYQLNNNSIPRYDVFGNKNLYYNPWIGRYCRRTRRHFAKLVDYAIPDERFLVRASISKGKPKPVDDYGDE